MFDSEEHILTEDELVVLCREWQEILRLEHWDIALRICRASSMKLQEINAEVNYVITKHCATVSIIDPVDYPDSPWKQDMELSLVHELLHLKYCLSDLTQSGSLEDRMFETAIDHTAKALVYLKRKSKEENRNG